MKKIYAAILLGIFLLTLVSSLTSLPPAKLNKRYYIRQTCSSCSRVNISISNTIDGIIFNNVEMVSNGSGVWIYEYTPTREIRHDVNGEGDIDGSDKSFSTYFLVNPTGQELSTSISIGSSIYLFLMIFLTSFFIFIGFKLSETDNLWILGIFFLFISLLFIIYDVWLGYAYHLNYVSSISSSRVPEIIFYLLLMSLSAGLLVSAILLFKRLPEVVSWLKINVAGKSEDDWDNDKY